MISELKTLYTDDAHSENITKKQWKTMKNNEKHVKQWKTMKNNGTKI